MKMAAAKQAHYESGPNMTPLVDVVMVLLIFLMMVGDFASGEHFLAGRTPGACGTIMPMASAWKLVGGLVGVVAGVAKHAVWYVRYQIEGVTHDQPRDVGGTTDD